MTDFSIAAMGYDVDQIRGERIRRLAFERDYDPSFGEITYDVMGEALTGGASLSQSLKAYDVDASREFMLVEQGTLDPAKITGFHRTFGTPAKEQGRYLSEEDWKNSDFYRQDIKYQPGMSEYSADILANRDDERKRTQFLWENASGLERAGAFIPMIAASIVEPKNAITGALTALVTRSPVGFFGNAGRLFQMLGSGRKAQITRAGLEGLVGAAVIEPSAHYSAKVMQDDYTMADSLLNIAASMGFSMVLDGGLGLFKDIVTGRRISAPEVGGVSGVKLTEKEIEDGLTLATEQFRTGQEVDVESIIPDTRERIDYSFAPEGQRDNQFLAEIERLRKEGDTQRADVLETRRQNAIENYENRAPLRQIREEY